MPQRAGRRGGVGGGSAGQERAARRERGGAGGCEANARRAKRRARRRRQPASTHGPRQSRPANFARDRAADRTSATEPVRLISRSAARHLHATEHGARNTPARRCRVSRNGRLGGPTERYFFGREGGWVEDAISRSIDRHSRGWQPRRGRCPRARSLTFSRACNGRDAAWVGGPMYFATS